MSAEKLGLICAMTAAGLVCTIFCAFCSAVCVIETIKEMKDASKHWGCRALAVIGFIVTLLMTISGVCLGIEIINKCTL